MVLLLSEGTDCGLIKLLCPRTEAENIGLLATEATETGSREQLSNFAAGGILLNRTRNKGQAREGPSGLCREVGPSSEFFFFFQFQFK